MTRQDKHVAEIEWFNAVERQAHKAIRTYSDIDKLREGGRGHYKPKKSIVERFLAFFA